MSYEGSVEFICNAGHYTNVGVYEGDRLTHCQTCGAPMRWSHSIDETNGEDDDLPHTKPAPKRTVGYIDIVVRTPLYDPDSDEWQPD